MIELFMGLQHGRCTVYHEEQGHYVLQRIEGVDHFKYGSANNDIPVLLEQLANKYNVNSPKELSISLITSEGKDVFEPVLRVLQDEANCNVLDLKPVLKKTIQSLLNDPKLDIREQGVNYGDINYRLDGNSFREEPFNLLAYTIKLDTLIENLR